MSDYREGIHGRDGGGRAAIGVTIVVTGRVQGVGFRAWTIAQARRLGVCGRVRNSDSGDVEVFAEAGPETIRQFVALLEKGPPLARVEGVSVRPAPVQGYRDFSVDLY